MTFKLRPYIIFGSEVMQIKLSWLTGLKRSYEYVQPIKSINITKRSSSASPAMQIFSLLFPTSTVVQHFS
jgi:hypothetical protein